MTKAKVKSKRGYTLVELVVVMAVMAIVAIVAIYGLGTSGKAEDLRAASRELVGNLRSVQNKVINGAGGVNFKQITNIASGGYNVDGAPVTLKSFLTISTFKGIPPTGTSQTITSLCFAHPAVTGSFSPTCQCNAAICNAGAIINDDTVYIKVTGPGGAAKYVVIEQNSTTKQITRIYEQ
jgi:prepilin-type N-terminal cleavage/methylation domain-containing protein